MDAANGARRQLGRLMVEEGFLSQEQLTHALGEQSRTGRPLGEILVELGYVSPGAVANALAEQHGGLLRTEYGVSAGLRPVPDPAEAAAEEAAARAATAGGLRVVSGEPGGLLPQDEPELGPQARLQLEVERRDRALQELGLAVQARDAELLELRARLAEAAPADREAAPQPALQAALEEREAQIADLSTQVQQLQASLRQQEAGLTRLREADAALAAALAERDGLAGRIAELEAAVALASTREAERGGHEAEHEERLSEAEARLAAIAAERDGLVARVAQLEAEAAAAASAPGVDLSAQLAHVQAEASARLRAAAETLQALTGERDALARRVAELEAKRSKHATQELERRLAETAADRDAQAHRLAALEVELEAAVTRAQERETEIAAEQALRARLAENEQELADRDERLAAAGAELARVRMELEVLRTTAPDPTDAVPAAEPEPPRAHLLFVPGLEAYRLEERPGPAPAPGTLVELDGAAFVVARHGRSPRPGDDLVCACLLPV